MNEITDQVLTEYINYGMKPDFIANALDLPIDEVNQIIMEYMAQQEELK